MSRTKFLKSVIELYQSTSPASTQCRACLAEGWQFAKPRAVAAFSIWRSALFQSTIPGAPTSGSSLTHKIRYGETAALASAAVPQEHTAKSCWFCGDCTKTEHQFSCNNCGYLQPPNSDIDYFALFRMRRTFEIDQKDLERTFREMQIFVHPDKHATKGSDIKEIAQQQSAHLNTGYSILRCPLARAQYLLELEGKPIDEQSRIDDPGFLMEVMEIREDVSAAQGKEEILSLLERNLQRRTEYAERIRTAYATMDLAEMAKLVQELTYFHRIEESLRDKL